MVSPPSSPRTTFSGQKSWAYTRGVPDRWCDVLACLTFDVEGLQAHPKKAVESFHAALPRAGRTPTSTAIQARELTGPEWNKRCVQTLSVCVGR